MDFFLCRSNSTCHSRSDSPHHRSQRYGAGQYYLHESQENQNRYGDHRAGSNSCLRWFYWIIWSISCPCDKRKHVCSWMDIGFPVDFCLFKPYRTDMIWFFLICYIMYIYKSYDIHVKTNELLLFQNTRLLKKGEYTLRSIHMSMMGSLSLSLSPLSLISFTFLPDLQ